MAKINAKKSRKIKNIFLILLIAFVFLLSIILYSNFIDYISILEKKEVYASVNVNNYIGFDINSTALKFGTIPPGNSAFRKIYLENSYNDTVRVKIYVEGKIKDFVEVSDNDFILLKNEKKEVNFVVKIPSETEFGFYEGKIIVFIKNSRVR